MSEELVEASKRLTEAEARTPAGAVALAEEEAGIVDSSGEAIAEAQAERMAVAEHDQTTHDQTEHDQEETTTQHEHGAATDDTAETGTEKGDK